MAVPSLPPRKRLPPPISTYSCKQLQEMIKQLQDEKVRNGGILDGRSQAELDRLDQMFRNKNCTHTK